MLFFLNFSFIITDMSARACVRAFMDVKFTSVARVCMRACARVCMCVCVCVCVWGGGGGGYSKFSCYVGSVITPKIYGIPRNA